MLLYIINNLLGGGCNGKTKIVMLEGEHGTNIKSVEKSASDGLTDTYTITLTDGSKSSFNVTN